MKRTQVIVSGLLWVLSSCSGGPKPDLALLESDDAPYDYSAERERLRKLQLVQGTLKDSVDSFCSDPVAREALANIDLGQYFVEPGQIISITFDSTDPCLYEAEVEAPADRWSFWARDNVCGASAIACDDELKGIPGANQVGQWLCVAHAFRAAAELDGVASTGGDSTGAPASFSLPPQARAARPAMLARARLAAQKVAEGAFTRIDDYMQNGSAYACGLDQILDTLSASYVEAFHLYDSLTDLLVEETLAVADGQRSWSSSLQQAVDWSISGAELSRAAAAHWLVGGEPGLRPPDQIDSDGDGIDDVGTETRGGFCTAPRLSPQASKAVSVFRIAAPDPVAVLANPSRPDATPATSVTIEDLLSGDATSLPSGSLRKRLGELPPYPEFNDGCATDQDVNCVGGPGAASEFAEAFGVNIEAFIEAREHLAQEIRAFSRSGKAVLNPTSQCTAADAAVVCSDTCVGNTCTTALVRRKFVATAKDPEPVDAIYWATIAQYEQYAGFAAWNPGVYATTTNLLNFVDGAITSAQLLANMANDPATTTLSSSQRDDIVNPLALLIGGEVSERPFRVAFDGEVAPTTGAAVWIYGAAPLDMSTGEPTQGFRVMRGEDGLRCATTGSIEGAPCDLDAETVTGAWSEFTFTFHGFTQGVKFTWQEFANNDRWYVVQPRDPAAPVAGTFSALVGGFHDPSRSGKGTVLMVNQRVQQRAADIIRPSRRWCARSTVECDDEEFEERLPLENELSDDLDGVESSWKRYLTLARQAADEADALGQEYIENALADAQRTETISLREDEQRRRVEDELEQLQDICGTEIDPQDLLRELGESTSGDPDLSSITQLDPSEMTQYPGMAFQFGDTSKILKNAISEKENLRRLAECIADDDEVVFDWTTLGSRPLCVKVSPSGAVCAGVTADECVVDTVLCPECFIPPPECPPGYIKTDLALGYFDVDDGANSSSPATNEVCKAVRRLRENPGDDPAIRLVQGSTFFNPGNMRSLASRIGWRARVGGYSAIEVDGVPVFVTGDYWQTGNINVGQSIPLGWNWPCAPTPGERCDGLGTDHLFCGSYDCNNSTSRAELNDRMLRAVVALRATTLRSDPAALKGVYLPVYLQQIPDGNLPSHCATYPEVGQTVIWSRPHPLDQNFHISATRLEGVETLDRDKREITLYLSTGSGALATMWIEPNGTLWLDAQGNPSETFAIADVATNSGPLPFIDWYSGMSGIGTIFKGQPIAELLLGTRTTFQPIQSVELPLIQYQGKFRHVPDPPCVTSRVVSDFTYDPGAIWDALELACEVGLEDTVSPAATDCDPANPPTANGVDEMHVVESYVRCLAAKVRSQGARTLLRQLPERAADALRKTSITGAFPGTAGQLGGAISRLRAQLTEVAFASTSISIQLGTLADDIEDVRLSLEQAEIAAEIPLLEAEIAELSAQSTCTAALAAAAPGIGTGGASINPGAVATAGTLCDNAFAQASLADDIAKLRGRSAELSGRQVLSGFRTRIRSHASALNDISARLSGAVEEIDVSLAEVDRLRKRARRVVNRALFMDSFQAEGQEEISSAMRARKDVAKARYERARDNAVRLSFLAKRSIEQRLGLHLSELRETLPLVDAPATWESRICSLSGLDYSDLVAADGQAAFESFADEFIGDYVSRLENVVESYRLTFGLQEGLDTAVVSLREDVQNVHGSCEVESGNLLVHSGDLTELGAAGGANWFREGCLLDGAGEELPNCVDPLATDESPFVQFHPDRGAARGYEVRYGVTGLDCTAGGTCGFQSRSQVGDDATSALAQTVVLDNGRYLLSWYEKAPSGGAPEAPRIRLEDGTVIDPGAPVPDSPTACATDADCLVGAQTCDMTAMECIGWRRYHVVFLVDDLQPVTVRFIQNAVEPEHRFIAAVMLQDISNLIDVEVPPDPDAGAPAVVPEPALYVGTSETTKRVMPVCEDLDGETFRARNWKRSCFKLCADGFSNDCGGTAKTRCFRETSFDVSQFAIEQGSIFESSGFARGNFNYRIESVGLNFVGTGTRDCTGAGSSQACFAGASIPFTLIHDGPHFVRNHVGVDFEVSLFPGRIEQARGLAGERYLTNPLSSADQSLIEQVLRSEFKGRPLDGHYTLRVWDDPGVNFEAISDVQIVLNYRYWTRTE